MWRPEFLTVHSVRNGSEPYAIGASHETHGYQVICAAAGRTNVDQSGGRPVAAQFNLALLYRGAALRTSQSHDVRIAGGASFMIDKREPEHVRAREAERFRKVVGIAEEKLRERRRLSGGA